jgi:hypothetical protein
VWINDAYPVIAKIWRYLQQATWNDIKALPELAQGQYISDIKSLTLEERWLLGFLIDDGAFDPRNKVCGWSAQDNRTARFKRRIKPLLGNISHWVITNLPYERVVLKYPGSYFIDPPYQSDKSNSYKVKNDRNFHSKLAEHCYGLEGHVIACDGDKADWLPFTILRRTRARMRMRTDLICVLEDGEVVRGKDPSHKTSYVGASMDWLQID